MNEEIRFLKVIVQPNAPNSKILKVENNTYMIAVKAPAEKNKANIELLKFIKNHFNKKAKIVTGKTSKKKLLKFL